MPPCDLSSMSQDHPPVKFCSSLCALWFGVCLFLCFISLHMWVMLLSVLTKEALPACLLPPHQVWFPGYSGSGAVSYRLACLQGALLLFPHDCLDFIAVFCIPWLVAFKLSCALLHPLLSLPFHHSFLHFISPLFLLPASFPPYFLFVHLLSDLT